MKVTSSVTSAKLLNSDLGFLNSELEARFLLLGGNTTGACTYNIYTLVGCYIHSQRVKTSSNPLPLSPDKTVCIFPAFQCLDS